MSFKIILTIFALLSFPLACKPLQKQDSETNAAANQRVSQNSLQNLLIATIDKAPLSPKEKTQAKKVISKIEPKALSEILSLLPQNLDNNIAAGKLRDDIITKSINVLVPTIAATRNVPEQKLHQSVKSAFNAFDKKSKNGTKIAWNELEFSREEATALIKFSSSVSDADVAAIIGPSADGSIALRLKAPTNGSADNLPQHQTGEGGNAEIADMGMDSGINHFETARARDFHRFVVSFLYVGGLAGLSAAPPVGAGLLISAVLLSGMTVKVCAYGAERC